MAFREWESALAVVRFGFKPPSVRGEQESNLDAVLDVIMWPCMYV